MVPRGALKIWHGGSAVADKGTAIRMEREVTGCKPDRCRHRGSLRQVADGEARSLLLPPQRSLMGPTHLSNIQS